MNLQEQLKEFQPGDEIEMDVTVTITKDWSLFGGPDMWNLNIRRPSDNFPMGVRWMDAGNVERLLGIKLPRYKGTPKGKLVPIKK